MVAEQVRTLAYLPCGCIPSTPPVASQPRAPCPRRSAMATLGNVPDEQRWQELARVTETLTGQVPALAEAGGHEIDRCTGLEHTAGKIQEAVAGLFQRQGTGTGAGTAGERHESNPMVGKTVDLEGFTNKPCFEQWCRRYSLVAGAKDERLKSISSGLRPGRRTPQPGKPSSKLGKDEQRRMSCAAPLRQPSHDHRDRDRGSLHRGQLWGKMGWRHGG